MRGRGAVTALMVLVLLVPACGSERGPATAPAPGGSPTVATAEALVTYSRSGGAADWRFSVVARLGNTSCWRRAGRGRWRGEGSVPFVRFVPAT